MNFDIHTASILEAVIDQNIDMIVNCSTKNTLHFSKILIYFNAQPGEVFWGFKAI